MLQCAQQQEMFQNIVGENATGPTIDTIGHMHIDLCQTSQGGQYQGSKKLSMGSVFQKALFIRTLKAAAAMTRMSGCRTSDSV